jgi:hypothetical protein
MADLHPGAQFLVNYFGASSLNPIYLSSLPNAECKDREPGERHIISRSSEQIAAFVGKWDRPGRGVYFAVSTVVRTATRRSKETLSELVGVHADIDYKSLIETPEEVERIVGRLQLLPTAVNHSGHGLHLFYGFKDAIPATLESIAETERLLRMLAGHLGGDPAVCQVAALMRLPGTTNSKNGDSIPVRTIVSRQLRYEVDELQEWLKDAAPLLHRKDKAKHTQGNGKSEDNPFEAFAKETAGEAPIDVDKLLAEMVYLGPGGGGNAHNSLLRATAAMLGRGEAVDAVVAKALDALRTAAEKAATAFDATKEERTIREMCATWVAKHPEVAEKAENGRDTTEPDPLAGFHFDGIGSIEPEARLIDNLLSTTGLTLIGGQSGAGKSYLAIAMAVCLAEKKPFFGREVRERVGALYIAGEGQGAIAARIAAAKGAIGVEPHRQLPIAWLDTPPPLNSPQKIDAFVARLSVLSAKFQQDHSVRLGIVVFDTATACFELKDENDNAEVAKVCKTMQAVAAGFDGVVVAVHHYGKSLEAGPRGASAWRGSSEIVLGVLADVDPLSGDVKSRELAITKNRDGSQGPVAPFTLEFTVLGTASDGREFGACFVKPDLEGENRLGKAKKRRASRSETALRDAVIEALDSFGTNRILRSGGPIVRAVAIEHVRLEFNRRYAVDEEDELKGARAKRVAFNRALEKLPAEFGMGECAGTQWIWRA